MSNQTSLLRRLFALVAVVALVGVALPVVPASAATDACPSTIPSAGYRDLGGLSRETVEAIDCITYYRIAEGLTARSFDPHGMVPRWQMALFLVRTGEALGIPLPSGTDQGFTDLAGVATATRTAINQLAQLGITKGVGTGRFAPFDPVPRWQMALFLTRLYAKAGLAIPSGASQGFTDTGDLPLDAWYAVNQLAQLGITKGVDASRFGPYGHVYRWQMALFLGRQLQASHARPVTVTVTPNVSSSPSSEAVQLTVLVREPGGRPLSGRYVDVFVGSLDSSKRCVLDSDASLSGGDAGTGSNCKIDTSDPKTNSLGVATIIMTHSSVSETDTVYAWVGDSGQTFDGDEVPSYGNTQVHWTVPVAKLRVDDVTAKYGTQTQVKARMLTSGDLPVPVSGQRVVFTVTRDSSQIIVQAVTTGSDGVATLTYTGPADPTTGNDPAKEDQVKAFWDKNGNGIDDGAAEFDATAKVSWDDADPSLDMAKLTQSSNSTLIGQSVTVTMTVSDKFGVGYSNARVTFVVSGANGTTKTDDTDASGVAQISYTPAVSGIDTIDARVDFDRDGTMDPEDFDYGDVIDLTHYGVQTAPSLTGGVHSFYLLGVDLSADAIDVKEVGIGNLYRLTYDSTNDLFSVDSSAKNIDQFETALASLTLPNPDGSGGVELKTNTYTTSTSGSSTFILDTR